MTDSQRVLQARLDDLHERAEKADKDLAELKKRLDDADTPAERKAIRRKIEHAEDEEDTVDELLDKLRAKGVTIEDVDDDGDEPAGDEPDEPTGKKKIRGLKPPKDEPAGEPTDEPKEDKPPGDDPGLKIVGY